MVISIITPSLNQGKFIERSICSVLSQKGSFAIDYIIMDGGSTDETLAIIRKYERLLNENRWPVKCKGISFRWWSEPDNGQSHAINKGFSRAEGGLLAWLNSDDEYLPGSFSAASAKCLDFEGILYGEGEWVSEEGVNLARYPTFHPSFYSLSFKCTICQPTVFIKRCVYQTLGELSAQYHLAFDYEYWLRAVFSGIKFKKISKTLAVSRMYHGNKSLSMSVQAEREARDLQYSYYKNLFLNPFILALSKFLIVSCTTIREKKMFKKLVGVSTG